MILTASWLPAGGPLAAVLAGDSPRSAVARADDGSDDGSSSITTPGNSAYLIPAAASSWGAAGTRWLTEVFMVNPWSVDVSADLFFMLQYQDNTDAEPVELTIPGGAVVRLNDVVGTTFGTPDAVGAVLIGAEWPLFVSSRTANHTEAGTFGQLVPAMEIDDLSVHDEPVRLLHLTSNQQFRTNLGFANAGPQPFMADVEVYRNDGTLLHEMSVSLPPFSFNQLTDSLASAGEAVDDAYALIHPSSDDSRFFTYASVVDRMSGDPTFVTPRHATSEPVVIPAVARAPGYNQTLWRSEVTIHNPSDQGTVVAVELLPGTETAARRSSVEVELPAGTSRRYTDVLGELFGYDGVGSLRLIPSGGAIMAMSRTYNTVDGQTLGQAIPGVAAQEVLEAGTSVELLQLRHSRDAANGFRTNLGFANIEDTTIIVDVLLFDDNGSFLGSRAIDLQPQRSLQINDIFREMDITELTTAHAVVRSTTPGASFVTYASVVDNQTGDPTYVQPLPMPAGNWE
jgi:hypothetical protein